MIEVAGRIDVGLNGPHEAGGASDGASPVKAARAVAMVSKRRQKVSKKQVMELVLVVVALLDRTNVGGVIVSTCTGAIHFFLFLSFSVTLTLTLACESRSPAVRPPHCFVRRRSQQSRLFRVALLHGRRGSRF